VQSDHPQVPRISEFHGIVIAMHYEEHGIPHFHAIYAGQEASIAIESLSIVAGSLPRRALGLVRQWASLHRFELEKNWHCARDGEPLKPIEALP
jgi:hypothetical protein